MPQEITPRPLAPCARLANRLGVGLALLVIPAITAAALPTNAEVATILDTHLIANRKAKGAAVALVDATGIRVVTAGFSRDTTPVKADDLFEIGSVTKTFTALLLAIADEKGEARLDDPVEKFLPDGIKLRDSADVPIRMVDLATQRSGLPRLATNMLPKDPKDPYADYTEQDLLDFVKSFKAVRSRNAQYEYSNIGFGLLGYALTRAANTVSYEALLRSRILKPLNMANTSSDPKRFTDRMTQPHDANGQPTPAWDLPFAHAGAGAIRATAGDMGRYIEVMAGINATPLAGAASLVTTVREGGPGRINPIALAWTKIPFDKREIMHHDGGTFGSSSSLMIDRAAKEGVFVVTNSSTPLMDITLQLMDRRHKLTPREFPKVVAVEPNLLARYAGTYKLTEDMDIVVRVRDGKVTAQATRQGEFEIFPENETRFFARVAPIVMTFGDIAGDKAGSFLLEQGGVKLTGRRIPQELR